jgi:hypothetical protein
MLLPFVSALETAPHSCGSRRDDRLSLESRSATEVCGIGAKARLTLGQYLGVFALALGKLVKLSP